MLALESRFLNVYRGIVVCWIGDLLSRPSHCHSLLTIKIKKLALELELGVDQDVERCSERVTSGREAR